MSFVGPRPVVLTETDLLRMRDRNGSLRVRPDSPDGLVNGRDLVSVADKAVLDGYYVDNMSFSMDWQILQRTVGYVLRARDISEGATIGAVTGRIPPDGVSGKKRVTFSLNIEYGTRCPLRRAPGFPVKGCWTMSEACNHHCEGCEQDCSQRDMHAGPQPVQLHPQGGGGIQR